MYRLFYNLYLLKKQPKFFQKNVFKQILLFVAHPVVYTHTLDCGVHTFTGLWWTIIHLTVVYTYSLEVGVHTSHIHRTEVNMHTLDCCVQTFTGLWCTIMNLTVVYAHSLEGGLQTNCDQSSYFGLPPSLHTLIT